MPADARPGHATAHRSGGEALGRDEFAGIFSRETIARYIAESTDLLGDARINVFVPVLAHRFARERLKALAQARASSTRISPRCCSSACTTPAAARWPRVCSSSVRRDASTSARPARRPADEINPAVVEAMSELGVDMSEEFPKPLTDEVVRAADVVITMGCGDACPIYPGKSYEDWELDDPAGQDLATVRRIRDEIDRASST